MGRGCLRSRHLRDTVAPLRARRFARRWVAPGEEVEEGSYAPGERRVWVPQHVEEEEEEEEVWARGVGAREWGGVAGTPVGCVLRLCEEAADNLTVAALTDGQCAQAATPANTPPARRTSAPAPAPRRRTSVRDSRGFCAHFADRVRSRVPVRGRPGRPPPRARRAPPRRRAPRARRANPAPRRSAPLLEPFTPRPAQRSTAQRSAAQRSAAQRSAAQRLRRVGRGAARRGAAQTRGRCPAWTRALSRGCWTR